MMEEQLGKKQVILVGVMLFSLFFGAGNLIFPPFLGQEAGPNTFIAMIGFAISAIVFPILGILVVSRTQGLDKLASRVNSKFSFVFTILIYLSIGPLLGIPRAGSLPYEMVLAPFASENLISHNVALFLFTSVFFGLSFWLAMKPSKLIDRLGKVLTPTLLILILFVFLGSFFSDFSGYSVIQAKYVESALVSGFLDGYQTMDTIAALNFGLVISLVIKDMGVKDNKVMISTTIKAGIIAGSLLLFIYLALAYLGTLSGAQYGMTDNGAQTLTNITMHIFGPNGLFLLATIFTLACLTTAVGLISSISQYFSTISRINYKSCVSIFVLWSLFIANFGLTNILRVSVPILNAIYPLALVLIVLALLDNQFKANTNIYKYTIGLTTIISLIKVADSLHYLPKNISLLFSKIPLYTIDMGWLFPVLLLSVFIFSIEKIGKQN